jgi:hypothetical protein
MQHIIDALSPHTITIDGVRGTIKPAGKIPTALRDILAAAKPDLLALADGRAITVDAAGLRGLVTLIAHDARVIAAIATAQSRVNAAWDALSAAELASWRNYCTARLRSRRVPSGAAARAGVDIAPGAAAEAVRVATMDRLCAARSGKVPAGLLAIWHADQGLARANEAARWLP